jgi:hypothetical protein
VVHADERLVIARFHVDLRQRFQIVIDNERQPITLTDGWDCTMRAIGKERIDLRLFGHLDVVAELLAQIRKMNVMRGRQNGQHIVAAAAPQDDALGQAIS